jgi:hypothetical protein
MSQTVVNSTLTKAFAGMLADAGPNDVITRIQAEASAEMPFGIMVAEGAADEAGILPVDGTSKFAGLLMHSHAYAKDTELGTVGIKPKAVLSILRKGRAWVTVEETVAKGDPVFIRHTASGGNTQKGAFRKSADTATATDLTKKGVYLTAATAGNLALVEIDMTNG